MTLHRLHPRVRFVADLELVGRDEAAWAVRLLPSVVLVVLWLRLVVR